MSDQFGDHWLRCAKYIEPALDGSYAIEDVEHEIREGRAKLWPLERSAVVTQVCEYPQHRAVRVWLAGGELDEIRRYLPALDNYARSVGCSRVEVVARKGWAKVLTGFDANRIVYTKELG